MSCVSVKERTREMDFSRLWEPQKRTSSRQFVIEALVISMVGGGIGLGVGLVNLVAAFSPLKPEVTPLSIVLAVGVSGSVGVFFGILPAQQAANLDPALRTGRTYEHSPEGIRKSYRLGSNNVEILKGIDLEISR